MKEATRPLRGGIPYVAACLARTLEARTLNAVPPEDFQRSRSCRVEAYTLTVTPRFANGRRRARQYAPKLRFELALHNGRKNKNDVARVERPARRNQGLQASSKIL
jgi:hypothetical protein